LKPKNVALLGIGEFAEQENERVVLLPQIRQHAADFSHAFIGGVQ